MKNMEFRSGDVPFGNEETSPEVVSGHPKTDCFFLCNAIYFYLYESEKNWSVLVVYACTCLDEVGKIPWVMYHYRKYIWVKDLTREL